LGQREPFDLGRRSRASREGWKEPLQLGTGGKKKERHVQRVKKAPRFAWGEKLVRKNSGQDSGKGRVSHKGGGGGGMQTV